MLSDYNLFLDNTTMNEAVFAAKELFGENVPYTIEQRLEGAVIIFDTHFMETLREALSSGCMAKMNSNEEELFIRFVEYQNGHSYRDISELNVDIMGALDTWLTNLVMCIPNAEINGCFDNPRHTWEECNK